jgi:hypothetical protein
MNTSQIRVGHLFSTISTSVDADTLDAVVFVLPDFVFDLQSQLAGRRENLEKNLFNYLCLCKYLLILTKNQIVTQNSFNKTKPELCGSKAAINCLVHRCMQVGGGR